MTPEENPYEAGLGFCVRLEKGEFIGREALLKAKENGLERRLCTLTVGGNAWNLYGGEAVRADGQVISRVRSGGYGYSVGKNIAFAYLPLQLSQQGTRLEVEIFGEPVEASVAADVLHDPQGERLRV